MNLKLLKNRNFALLIIGKFTSAIGSDMMSFALSLYVLNVTESATTFATMLSFAYIPRIILGPICGVFADWFDKKKIIVILDILSGFFILSLYIVSITIGLQLVHIYIAIGVLTCFSCLFKPAASAVIPAIMKEEELVDANAFNSLLFTLTSFVGPLLAAVLYGAFGLPITLLINGISFIISSISEMFIDMPKLDIKEKINISLDTFVKDFVDGFIFANKTKIIRNLLLSTIATNFVFAPMLFIGIPFILKVLWKVSDIQFAIYQIAGVCGAILGSLLINVVSKRLKIVDMYIYGLLTLGITTGCIGMICYQSSYSAISKGILPYILLSACSFTIMLVATIMNVSTYTILQSETPLDKYGRVISMWETLGMALIPIGQFAYGYLCDIYPAYIPIFISAVVVVLVSLVFKANNVQSVNSSEAIVES